MYITNLDSDETLEAMFNPREVEVALAPVLTRLAIPTLAYQPIQFAQTANLTVDFSLTFSAAFPGAEEGFLQKVEAFLFSICFPPDVVRTLADASPPDLLFVWPGWLALRGVMTSVKHKATQFAAPPSDPVPTMSTYDLKYETLGGILGSESVRLVGLQWGQ